MRPSTIIAIVAVIVVTSTSSAQHSTRKPDSTKHHAGRPTSIRVPVDTTIFRSRPEISLQKALVLAEDFIKKDHIDIEHFYLSSANMIDYGSPNGPKEQMWYFWWVNDNHSMGDYVEIIVSMKGTVRRLASV